MDLILHTIILASLTLLPLLGYNVVFGKGKLLHFGQEGTALISVYTIWVLVMQYDVPLGIAFVVSLLASMLVGLLFAWMSFRLEPDGFGVMSIAVHLSVLAIVLNWQSVTRGALGIPRIPRAPFPATLEGFAAISLVVVVLWIFFLWILDRGPFGRALVALSENEWHAESLGVQRKKIHACAFLLPSIGVSLSSLLYPPYLFFLSPTDFNFPFMIFLIMIVVAGGPGRLWGVTIATFALSFLKEGLRFIALPASVLGPVRLMLFGLILIGAVWWRRDTLFPHERKI